MSEIASPVATVPLFDATRHAPEASRHPREQEMLNAELFLAAGAAEKTVEEVISRLNAGANPNQVNEHAITPLHVAARFGTREKVEALLRAGAKLEPLTTFRETPTHWAAHHANAGTLLALVDAGASTSLRNAFGFTPAEALEANAHNLSPLDVEETRGAIRQIEARAAMRQRGEANAPSREPSGFSR
ncbi:ankyrin repeat domain-containing protein [Burkholderia vietnamiensis]|uniref:Ankyrin n=1 Tax=Burkholderia vietnamiensis (strain G4 / LMG 22486) TaxID=269482 RepID=A4JFH5_BURVG|nr:Ankyrin [Burkholderia vietnamiensis G4]MCB4344787.1 ankyrin repeat domain-containing protein [Burkholderia vietnamiensis]